MAWAARSALNSEALIDKTKSLNEGAVIAPGLVDLGK